MFFVSDVGEDGKANSTVAKGTSTIRRGPDSQPEKAGGTRGAPHFPKESHRSTNWPVLPGCFTLNFKSKWKIHFFFEWSGVEFLGVQIHRMGPLRWFWWFLSIIFWSVQVRCIVECSSKMKFPFKAQKSQNEKDNGMDQDEMEPEKDTLPVRSRNLNNNNILFKRLLSKADSPYGTFTPLMWCDIHSPYVMWHSKTKTTIHSAVWENTDAPDSCHSAARHSWTGGHVSGNPRRR